MLLAISCIINTSLEKGRFSYHKDTWFGTREENFKPVHNFQFLYNLTEKAVAEQMISHIMAYALGFSLNIGCSRVLKQHCIMFTMTSC